MSSTDSSSESDNFEEYGISPYCHEPTKSKMQLRCLGHLFKGINYGVDNLFG